MMVLAQMRCTAALVVRVNCWLLGLGDDAVGGGADVLFRVVMGMM